MVWSLRVRGPAGQATVSLDKEGHTTGSELQALLAQHTGIAAAQQEVLAGFPPKALQVAADASVAVASLGIQNGDSLTVRAAAAAAAPPAAASAPAVPDSAPISSNGVHAAAAEADDEDAMLAAAIAASLEQQPPAQQPPRQPQRQQQEFAGGSISPPPEAVGQTPAGKAPAPTSVQLPDGSCVVRRVIPSDNSCLFTAVGYVMENNRGKATALRKVIADGVAADPVTYNEGFLGQDNPDYQTWILDKKNWGGAIELSILSKHYGRVIAAYDIQTKRCDRYGELEGYPESVMLIYDGLHYDALAVSAFDGAPEELDVTVLRIGSTDAEAAATGAEQLVAACHQARQFTDIANFTLRCGVCQIGIKGEKEAVEHAKATGHQNFAEY